MASTSDPALGRGSEFKTNLGSLMRVPFIKNKVNRPEKSTLCEIKTLSVVKLLLTHQFLGLLIILLVSQ